MTALARHRIRRAAHTAARAVHLGTVTATGLAGAAAIAPTGELIGKAGVAVLAPGVVVLVELTHLLFTPLVVVGIMVHAALRATAVARTRAVHSVQAVLVAAPAPLACTIPALAAVLASAMAALTRALETLRTRWAQGATAGAIPLPASITAIAALAAMASLPFLALLPVSLAGRLARTKTRPTAVAVRIAAGVTMLSALVALQAAGAAAVGWLPLHAAALAPATAVAVILHAMVVLRSPATALALLAALVPATLLNAHALLALAAPGRAPLLVLATAVHSSVLAVLPLRRAHLLGPTIVQTIGGEGICAARLRTHAAAVALLRPIALVS